MNELEAKILEAARRRTISVRMEAGVNKVDESAAKAAIRKLLRAKLIYRSDSAKPNFWGGVSASYRAN